MSQKIAIIELYQHDEVVDGFLHHLDGSVYTVEIYCSLYVFQSLNTVYCNNNIKWIPMNEKDKIPFFLEKEKGNIQQNSLLIFTTVFSHFNTFKNIISHQKSILVIHNVHWQLAPKKHYKIASTSFLTDILRIIKVRVLNTEYNRKKLVDKMDAIAVGSEEVLKYLHSRNTFTFKKNTYCIPFACYQKKKTRISDNFIKIVVPGIVSKENRNYLEVLEALRRIKAKLRKKIRLILLGYTKNTEGKKILAKFSRFQNPQISIEHFTAPIPMLEYNRIILNADFLIIPARRKTSFHTCYELNGHSKIMGTLNDAIKFKKPALLPSFYPVAPALLELIGQYDSSSDLSDKIVQWVNHDIYTLRASKTILFEKIYECLNIKEEFIKNISQLLDS